jgi:hypothetical protein
MTAASTKEETMSDTDTIPELEPATARVEDLTGGQTETEKAAAPVNPSEPELVAKRFLEHRAASVKEEVTGNVILNQGIAACADDSEKYRTLLRALVGAKVISQAEADAGEKANKSTVSMLKKIGKHANTILDPRILPYLQPGYSVLYQFCNLIETLEKNNETD